VNKPSSIDIPINAIIKMDILQPKFDGWYAEGRCVAADSNMILHSSTGERICTLRIQPKPYTANDAPYTLRGEYMFGTNRAKNDPKYLSYMVYDIIINAPYLDRHFFLRNWIIDYQQFCEEVNIPPRIFLVHNYGPDSFSYFFEEIKSGRLEGLVGRNFNEGVNSAIHRYKPNFCVDYILLDLERGAGKYADCTGSFVGGQWKGGKLVPICRVAGMSDQVRHHTWEHRNAYLGKVFEAEGSQYFAESGALRHPRFKRWRLDVLPQDVIFAKEVRYAA
jgi:ATP-dependent DNA ligase